MNLDEMLAAVHSLPCGDYAECGVWQGRTAKQIAKGMNINANLWLFDSFHGHGEPHEFDDAAKHPRGRYADTSAVAIHKLIPNAYVVPGFITLDMRNRIPAVFECVRDKVFRFVHIDLDHYLPTKAACMFFAPRMVKGGYIRFDDYGHDETPGATRAINEIFGTDHLVMGDWRFVRM